MLSIVGATSVGFLVKFIWDRYLVYNVSIKAYVGSSFIATIVSTIIEYFLLNITDVTVSATLSLLLGYNLKFFLDNRRVMLAFHS